MSDYSNYSIDQVKKMAFERELYSIHRELLPDEEQELIIKSYLQQRIQEIDDLYKDF